MYDATDYPPFAVTVDLAMFTLRGPALSVLLVRRGEEPFQGMPALPGGFVHADESADVAARRELAEETGLDSFPGHLEQLATYSEPGRDPRMRVVSVVFVAFAPNLPEPSAGSDAADAYWTPVEDASRESLAFDHAQILADALERVRSKLEYTTLATHFVESPFSIRDLQTVYEAVWDVTWDRANFRRKVLGTRGFVEPVEGVADAASTGGRRAQLYRPGDATTLHPPIPRP
ncbi:Hypothetical Nudix-like regulator [Rhodococcus wratislaviensis]|uniref:Hypothetical Nudix-like regulator n=1 Tax=Rhodococcus wratislaviensis TaxID=44752 RepID=A0A402BY12_RHOWR|nr:NUDIX domain-containing protein [Rhodococcus wratislaviensis]GCE36119.1 Hypothetical Nudix-like regulator [Rhodococcus wratislaviensis]